MAEQFARFTELNLVPLSKKGGSFAGAFRSARATGIVVFAFAIIVCVVVAFSLTGAILQLITGVDRSDFATPTSARLTAIPGIIFGLVLLGVAIFFVVRFFRDGFKRQRMAEFAKANGLNFIGYKVGARMRGVGFNAPGDNRWHMHVVTGAAQGHEFELGDFEVTESRRDSKGRKRTSTVVRFAYIAVRMPIAIPHTFFDAIDNGKWRIWAGNLKRWDLEGHFPTQFRTFTVPGREREMLEVISPDVMQVFSDNGRGYDIELTGDHLILLQRGDTVTNPEDLGGLLTRASALTAGLDYRIREWHRE